jgi:hypothetical protein
MVIKIFSSKTLSREEKECAEKLKNELLAKKQTEKTKKSTKKQTAKETA